MGTHGIQTPIRWRANPTESAEYLAYAGSYSSRKVPGVLVGTKRLHDPEHDFGEPEGPTVHGKWLTAFNTHTGKAILHKSPWEDFADFYERIRPRGDELWVTSGRVNEIWQSSFDDDRRKSMVSSGGQEPMESRDHGSRWREILAISSPFPEPPDLLEHRRATGR